MSNIILELEMSEKGIYKLISNFTILFGLNILQDSHFTRIHLSCQKFFCKFNRDILKA